MTDPRFDKWSRFDVDQEVNLALDQMVRPDGTPIYEPVGEQHPGWQRFTAWRDLGPWGKQLRAKETKHVYLSPDGQRLWNLAGSWAGKEGVVLAPKLKGSQHIPFEQRYSAGPYMIGEQLERTDYPKRVYQLGVIVGPAINLLARKRYTDSDFAYRMLEEKWWADWPENHRQPAGFWGTYTRTHGFRWIRVRLGKSNDQDIDLDPVAYGNNCQQWAMTIDAPFPFYSKRPFVREWRNDAANAVINGRNHGVLHLVNRSDWDAWPKLIIEGVTSKDGDVTIQDGITGRMVPLPRIFPGDGMILCDTDPAARTLTAENDPVDNILFQTIRNSEIADWLIGDITGADSGLPVGRRMPGGIGFSSPIPAKSDVHLKVTHTHPNARITAIVPQRYKMGWA